MYLLDRTIPALSTKLHQSWRRLQQHRRQRDPEYQRFVQNLPVTDALELFAQVLKHVPHLYVDRERARPELLWSYGLEELAYALDDPLFQNRVLPRITPELLRQMKGDLQRWRHVPIQQPRQGRQQLRRLLSDWQELTPIARPSAIILEVVQGACNGLDEYSYYQPPLPPAAEELQPQGLILHYGEEAPVIASVIRGSWAELHTPLRAGQVIVQINGHGFAEEGATREKVLEALGQVQQNWHEVVVATGDPDMPEIAVNLPVQPPSVYGRSIRLLRSNRRIGYIRIGSLRDSTPRELDDALLQLRQDGSEALVLDLRGNWGGSFTAAIEVVRRFLSRGVIVTTQGQLPEVNNAIFTSTSGAAAWTMPLVVLVDGETASAAELLAAALKDQQRALLIGTSTFGKGTLQYALPLTSTTSPNPLSEPAAPKEAGCVRLTIAHLITPNGSPLHLTGVQPHIIETDPQAQLQLAWRKAGELLPAIEPITTPESTPTSEPMPTPTPMDQSTTPPSRKQYPDPMITGSQWPS
jgi:C-terminal peptidase prc